MVCKACCVLGPKNAYLLNKVLSCLTWQKKLRLISNTTALDLEKVQPVGLISLFCNKVILNNNKKEILVKMQIFLLVIVLNKKNKKKN